MSLEFGREVRSGEVESWWHIADMWYHQEEYKQRRGEDQGLSPGQFNIKSQMR